MRLINVETFKLEEFFYQAVPPYAILSHTWGTDSDEVSFRNIEEGKTEKAGIRPIKLEGCCKQAKNDGLRYAWIDTCCIDKTNSVELGEAINSMFRWYSLASICYVYLSDVPADDNPRDPGSKFFSSRWFKRGWTLQELLAPKKLHFYNSDWCCLGTNRDMSVMIEKITGIPRPFLLGMAELRDASVAQRMSWAAKRATKRKEDTAYCLLGIFGIVMPMIYGEGDQAFRRLQQEIMRETRDDSILAWGLSLTKSTPSNSTEVISGGVLASAPSDFANCGQIVSPEHHATSMNTFDIVGGCLRMHLSLFTSSAGMTYGLLTCGPGHNADQVVAIPLNTTLSGGPSDEYVRPQGRYAVLFPKAAPDASTKLIHIRKERQSRVLAVINRRHWFYVEESDETNLELIEVQPRDRWQEHSAMISTASGPDGNVIQPTFTRFRHRTKVSPDFVVVLEFEMQGSQVQTRCHVMISSRDTALEDMVQKFSCIRQEALGKQGASNGILNLSVTVRQEVVAAQPMFVVRLAAIPSAPEDTVDATLELQQLDLKLELVRILQEEDRNRLEAKGLGQQIEEKRTNLEPIKGQLAVVEEKLRKLREDRRLLVDGLERGSQEIDQLTMRGNKLGQRQDKLSERRLQAQRRLDDLKYEFDPKQTPENRYEDVVKLLLATGGVDADSTADDVQTPLPWAASNGYEGVVKLLLATGNSDADLTANDVWAALSLAASNGHEAVVQLLLDKGADVDSKDNSRRTPLSLAASNGHKAVVQLLLDKGADVESTDSKGGTPLAYAAGSGHEAIVKLLLDKGPDVESSKTSSLGGKALSWAAENGHEAVVKLLLDKGADIESEASGRTPLWKTAWNGHEAVVQLLLDKGADVESKRREGGSPLNAAAWKGHKAVVQLLLDKGADIESNAYGLRPLIMAAWNGDKALTQLLLDKGADVKSRCSKGGTPLSYAAGCGHETIVKLLLDKGADIESKDSKGGTPLSRAAANGHEAVIKLLQPEPHH